MHTKISLCGVLVHNRSIQQMLPAKTLIYRAPTFLRMLVILVMPLSMRVLYQQVTRL